MQKTDAQPDEPAANRLGFQGQHTPEETLELVSLGQKKCHEITDAG